MKNNFPVDGRRMESKLKSIQETEIDVGTFKYVYIRVYEDAGGDDM